MAEYIEREALVHRLKDPYLFNITPRIFEIISEIPAADVAPVRHAHRVDNGGFYYRCSECGGVLTYGGNYCPNCGARIGQN